MAQTRSINKHMEQLLNILRFLDMDKKSTLTCWWKEGSYFPGHRAEFANSHSRESQHTWAALAPRCPRELRLETAAVWRKIGLIRSKWAWIRQRDEKLDFVLNFILFPVRAPSINRWSFCFISGVTQSCDSHCPQQYCSCTILVQTYNLANTY